MNVLFPIIKIHQKSGLVGRYINKSYCGRAIREKGVLVHGLVPISPFVIQRFCSTIELKNKKLPLLTSYLNTLEWSLFVTLSYESLDQVRPDHLGLFFEYITSLKPNLNYFYVTQYTKRGIPHHHILINQTLPFVWISDRWNRATSLTLKAGTNCESINSKSSVINYILKTFIDYGSNLDLDTNLHIPTQQLLENETINQSLSGIEATILSNSESSAYKLFSHFRRSKYINEFCQLYTLNLRKSTLKNSSYFVGLTPQTVYNTILVYFLKSQDSVLTLSESHVLIAYEVYKLGQPEEQFKNRFEFEKAFSRDASSYGVLFINLFLQATKDLIREEFRPSLTLKDYDYITRRFTIKDYDLNILSNKLISEGFIFSRLPMVTKPVSWTKSTKDLRTNYTGGYLCNSKLNLFPLTDTPDANVVISSKESKLIDAINRLQASTFTFDWEAYDYLKTNYREAIYDRFDKAKIEFETALNGESIEDALRRIYRLQRVNADNKKKKKKKKTEDSPDKEEKPVVEYKIAFKVRIAYESYRIADSHKRELDRLCAQIDLFRTYLLPGDKFYFPYKIDFRGRFYVDSDITPISNTFVRNILRAGELRSFDLDWFKFQATKAYTGAKLSFDDRVKKFNLVENILFEYRERIDFKFNDFEDPLALLNCAFEYIRYRNHFKVHKGSISYYSNFLISVDATSSGNQIIALLLDDVRYRNFLNLQPSNSTGTPYSLYLEIGKQYLNKISKEDFKLYNNIKRQLPDKEESNGEKVSICFQFIKDVFKDLLMKRAYGISFIAYKDNLISLAADKYRRFNLDSDLINDLATGSWRYVQGLGVFRFLDILHLYIKLFNDYNERFVWTSPLGIRIELTYPKRSRTEQSVYVKIPIEPEPEKGRRFKYIKRKFTYTQLTDNLDKKKALLAGAPDFIHSFDASVIGLFAYNLRKYDMPFMVVHDQLLCCTGDMDFAHLLLRLTNYEIFNSRKVLESFLNVLDEQMVQCSERARSDTTKTRKKANRLANSIINDLTNVQIQVHDLLSGIRSKEPSNFMEILEAFNMYS